MYCKVFISQYLTSHNYGQCVCVFCLFVVAVRFNQSTYRVWEDVGEMQIGLVLSKPTSTDITVMIWDSAFKATSN